MDQSLSKVKYEAYLQSPRWAGIRRRVKERDGWTCQFCGTDEHLEVHHVHYRTVGSENGHELVTLCRLCHKGEHEDAQRAGGLKYREALWKSLRPCPLQKRKRMRHEGAAAPRLRKCPQCGHEGKDSAFLRVTVSKISNLSRPGHKGDPSRKGQARPAGEAASRHMP